MAPRMMVTTDFASRAMDQLVLYELQGMAEGNAPHERWQRGRLGHLSREMANQFW
jgi:hypothetical protein